ncbi:hypothetical protein H310_09270 [Aphanomyces invadans]|uniref:Uncharacterized protein n=1 Tax=Aphanomyces invadans TaxID=157072 RepID=A0A024TWH2_9STRA|nr:hypothetical protein H310_09270 [Aphanomyces invadans]ETV97961.1 hypothetical protein H310_09270 [Aphanomyces invadans]|eukprot:XP_008873522.1 hypothetical protein H310_09270 [Aphanomyces invadans]
MAQRRAKAGPVKRPSALAASSAQDMEAATPSTTMMTQSPRARSAKAHAKEDSLSSGMAQQQAKAVPSKRPSALAASSADDTESATPFTTTMARSPRAGSAGGRGGIRRSRRKEERLAEEVRDIQRDIHRLEGKRDCMLDYPMQATVLNDRYSTKIMFEYCTLFEFGFDHKNKSEGQRQEQFIRSIMREDLHITGVTFTSKGVDKLVSAHRMYASIHMNYRMKFVSSANILDDSGAVLVSELKTIISQRITRKMLELYYPLVFQYEALVQLLLGQMIEMIVIQLYEFDSLGCIEGYVPRIGVLEAFSDLLGNADLGALCALEHKLRTMFQ